MQRSIAWTLFLTLMVMLGTSCAHDQSQSRPEKSTALACEEVLLSASVTRNAQGADCIAIVAAPSAGERTVLCAARLTASLPVQLDAANLARTKPYCTLLPNTSATCALLSLESEVEKTGCVVIWNDLNAPSAPLLLECRASAWLSEHHVVLASECATVIDVRDPNTRYAFEGVRAGRVRASSLGTYLVLADPGACWTGTLDASKKDWRTQACRLPLPEGVTVDDAIFSASGAVLVTQESKPNAAHRIVSYRVMDGAWAKVDEIKFGGRRLRTICMFRYMTSHADSMAEPPSAVAIRSSSSMCFHFRING